MITEAEIRVKQPQVKEHVGPQEAGRGKDSPSEAPKRTQPCNIVTSGFWSKMGA